MTAPYRDHIQAIRAALNVDARSLYQPAGWQSHIATGYRETPLTRSHSDLTKLEAFQQACMTMAFLRGRLPPHLWAIIVVSHALKSAGDNAEMERLMWAMSVVAERLDYPRQSFAMWSVANWSGRLDSVKGRWDHWVDCEWAKIPTLKQHYGSQLKPKLSEMLLSAENMAERLLSDAGMIERVAA